MAIKGLCKLKDAKFLNQCIYFILACCVVYFINHYADWLAIEQEALLEHPEIYKATLFERFLGAPRYYRNTIDVHMGRFTLEEILSDPSQLEEMRLDPFILHTASDVPFRERISCWRSRDANSVSLFDSVSNDNLRMIDEIVKLDWSSSKGSEVHNRYLILRLKQFLIWLLSGDTFSIERSELFHYNYDFIRVMDFEDCTTYLREAGHSYFLTFYEFIFNDVKYHFRAWFQ